MMDVSPLSLLLLVAIAFFVSMDDGEACIVFGSGSFTHGPQIRPGYVGYGFNYRFRKRRSADPNPDAATIMRLCDVDGNSLISAPELRKCMMIPSGIAIAEVKKMDSNGDMELALNEIQTIQFETSGAENCYQAMLMRCGTRFLMYSRTHDSDETHMCGALQEYVDCVAEAATCDLQSAMSFKHALIDMIASGENDTICPTVDISALGKAGEYSTLSCSKQAIVDCDVMFLGDLHDGVNPCGSLAVYEQCIKDSTETCDDDPARYARAGSHSLVAAYLGNKICK